MLHTKNGEKAMIKLATTAIVLLSATLIAACTDAQRDRILRFNNETDIMCFSGSATPVFTDRSTGRVEYTENGGGVYYKSKNTGKFVQLYMDCVITGE